MLFLPEFVQTEYVARGFRMLIAPFGLDIAIDRERPESRVVFVQLPIRESVRNHCKGVRRLSETSAAVRGCLVSRCVRRNKSICSMTR